MKAFVFPGQGAQVIGMGKALAEAWLEARAVFDEVDAGVGGAVGLEIGSRLRRLAARSQVIVVTHLPQVAAHADHHFTITKSSDGQVTTSDVRELNEDERALELSRMMSGSKDSAAGLEHAVELLTRARSGTG